MKRIILINLLCILGLLTSYAQYGVINPTSPGDPQAPDIQVKHLVTVDVSPAEGGKVDYSVFYLPEGSTRVVTATANAGYEFVGWKHLTDTISEELSLSVFMEKTDLHLTALFAPLPFNPESPADPGINYFEPFSGRLIVNNFQKGELQQGITQALNGHSKTEVRTLLVIGEVSLSDLTCSDEGFAVGMTNCDSIDISLTTGYSSLPALAFKSLPSLKHVLLPENLAQLEENSFYDCALLDSVTIPAGMQTIAQYAFYGCPELKTVFWNTAAVARLPKGLTTTLTTVVIGGSVQTVPKSFCSNTTSALFFPKLEKVVLGQNVTTVDEYAFRFTGLKTLVIEGIIDSIGKYAFADTQLESLRVPESARIGSYAFANIKTLESVDIDGVQSLPTCMFSGCSKLNRVDFPSTLTSVGEDVFYICSKLTEVVWDAPSVTENPLRANLPSSLSSLKKITFGEHITAIPDYFCGTRDGKAFNELDSVVLGENVASIGVCAFYQSPLKAITARGTVPATVGEQGLEVSSASCDVYTPCESAAAYRAAWPANMNIVNAVSFQYTIVSGDTKRGSVTIDQHPACGDYHVQATATASEGFRFAYWNESSNTANPLYFLLTQDTVFTAYFESICRALFYNYDGTLLLNTDYISGEDPVYTGETPVAAGDDQTSYVFRGWDHKEDALTGNHLYYALYDTINNVGAVLTSMEFIGGNWNTLTGTHQFRVEGRYEHTAALKGMIQFDADNKGWQDALNDSVAASQTFSATIETYFSNAQQTHTLRFRAIDSKGVTADMAVYEYVDIRDYPLTGITDMTFDNRYLTQTGLQTSLESDKYTVADYSNNYSAGTASFHYYGVWPYTIGDVTYNFTILPATLTGTLVLEQDEFVYTGKSLASPWSFSNEAYSSLMMHHDYVSAWTDNMYPGTGTLTVTGIHNYTGTLTAEIHISKAPATTAIFTATLPDSQVAYDGKEHGAEVVVASGAGTPTVTYLYVATGTVSADKPVNKGTYEVWLAISEGECYLALENQKIGEFEIVDFDDTEWVAIQAIRDYLANHGQTKPWDLSAGVECLSTLDGVTMTGPHITGLDLSSQNISGTFPYIVFRLPYLETLKLSGNALSGDIESDIDDYSQSPDYPGVQTVQWIEVANNDFTGNIGAFAAAFPSLRTLKAGHNLIEAVYPMISADVNNLDLSYQTTDTVRLIDLTHPLLAETFFAAMPTVMSYSHQNRNYSRIGRFEIVDNLSSPDYGSALAVRNGVCSFSSSEYRNNVFRYGTEDVLWLQESISWIKVPVKIQFIDGDANFSGDVNLYDLQSMINFIFNEYDANSVFNFTASDLYADNQITVQDIVLAVEILLTEVSSQQSAISSQRSAISSQLLAVSDDTDATLAWTDGELHLYSNKPVAAMDLSVQTDGEVEWLIPSHKVTQKNTAYGSHAIVYSLQGNLIPANTDVVIARSTGLSPVTLRAMLSDANAQPLSVVAQPQTPTGIETAANENVRLLLSNSELMLLSVTAMSDAAWTIYDLQGSTLRSGIVSVEAMTPARLTSLDKNECCILVLRDNSGKTVLIEKIINK